MPNLPKLKLLPVVLALAAFLAVPAAAQATLAYTKSLENNRVYVANDNGSSPRLVGPGRNPHVSPDGETVVYERETKSGDEMRLYSVAARKSERLLNPWAESYVFAWSPDSSQIAAVTGPLNGPETLLVIDTETSQRTKVATGYFNGVSFSPESDEIVYGVSQSQDYPLKSNIFRYAIGVGASHAITHDAKSAYPLWGPTERIVFAKQLGAQQRQYGPKNELYTMSPKGTQVKRLTHTTVSPLAQGLVPTAFSESGNQLLAEFGGQDIAYAVAVNAQTGAEKQLTGNVEEGFVGAAISPDGKTVLGTTGLTFGGGRPQPNVATVPFKGGAAKVLVKNAFDPSWGD
jgi:dipeptidyl aminopeptidase/acylaminoacyl peptidase